MHIKWVCSQCEQENSTESNRGEMFDWNQWEDASPYDEKWKCKAKRWCTGNYNSRIKPPEEIAKEEEEKKINQAPATDNALLTLLQST